MKVFVIGATGEVDSDVVKALLQRGAGVRALTRKQRKPDAFDTGKSPQGGAEIDAIRNA